MSWSSQLVGIGRSADSTWTEFIAADESASLSFCSLLRPRRKLCRVVSSRPRSRPTRSTCLDFKVSKSYNMTERKLSVPSRPGSFCGLQDVHAVSPPATQQRRAPKVIGKSGYGLATVNEASILIESNGAAAWPARRQRIVRRGEFCLGRCCAQGCSASKGCRLRLKSGSW